MTLIAKYAVGEPPPKDDDQKYGTVKTIVVERCDSDCLFYTDPDPFPCYCRYPGMENRTGLGRPSLPDECPMERHPLLIARKL